MSLVTERDRVQHSPAATILVAASNPAFRRRLQDVLRQANYRVVVAEDGPQTLDLSKAESPDLVIFGPQLRPQDGEDICRLLRGVLVLVLSASSDERVVIEAFDQGADNHVTLPERPRVLLARMRLCVMWSRSAAARPLRRRLWARPAGRPCVRSACVAAVVRYESKPETAGRGFLAAIQRHPGLRPARSGTEQRRCGAGRSSCPNPGRRQ